MGTKTKNLKSQIISNLELKQLVEMKQGYHVIRHNDSIIMYNHQELLEYNKSGRRIKSSVKPPEGVILYIYSSDDLLISTSSKILSTCGLYLTLPAKIHVKKMVDLCDIFLIESPEEVLLANRTKIIKSIQITPIFSSVSPLLKSFIVISKDQLMTISLNGDHHSHFFDSQNIKSFCVRNSMLLTAQDRFLHFFSITCMIPIKNIEFNFFIQNLNFMNEKILGADFVLNSIYQIFFYDYSNFQVKFSINAADFQLLGSGFLVVDGVVSRFIEIEMNDWVKHLIVKEDFNEAARVCESQLKKNKNFKGEVVKKIINDVGLIGRYLLICEFLERFETQDLYECQLLVDKLFFENEMEHNFYSLAIFKVQSLLHHKKIMDFELNNNLEVEKFLMYEKNFYVDQNLLMVWIQFRESSCFNEIVSLFRNHDINQAFLLCMICMKKLTADEVFKIMKEVPAYLDVKNTIKWIFEVIPKLKSENLETFEEILIFKAIELDKNETSLEVILDFLEIPFKSDQIKKILKKSSTDLKKVKNLKSGILKLIRMKKAYSIPLTIEDLNEKNDEILGLRILEDLNPVNFDQKVKDLLKVFCEERSLNKDLLISIFIHDKTAAESRIIEKSFKQIVIPLIKQIKDPETRSLSIKNVLQCKFFESPILCEDLITYGLTFENSLKYFFLKIKLSDNFKRISQKYTSETIDVSKEANLMKFLIFVLNSDIVTCIEDALEIAEMVEGLMQEEVFIYFVKSVIEKQDLMRLDRLKKAFLKVSRVDDVLDGIVSFMLCILSDSQFRNDFEKDGYVFACKITEKIIQDYGMDESRLVDALKIVKKIKVLADGFGIFLTYREYFDVKCRKEKMAYAISIYIEFQLTMIESLNSDIIDYGTYEIPATTQEALFQIGSLLSIDIIDLNLKIAKEYSMNDFLYTRSLDFLKEISKYNLSLSQTKKAIKITSSILFKTQEVLLVSDLRQIFESIHFKNLKKSNIHLKSILKTIQNLQNVESFLMSQLKKPDSIEEWFPEDLQITSKSLLDLKDEYVSSAFLSDDTEMLRIVNDLTIANGTRTPLFLLESICEKVNDFDLELVDGLIEKQFWNVVNNEKLDESLLLQLLIDLPNYEVLNVLISEIQKGKNFHNQEKICKIGKIFCGIRNFKGKEMEWQKVEDFSKMNEKLKDFEINLAKMDDEGSESEKIFLVFEKGASIHLAFELAEYMNWKNENVICGYIKHLIAVPKLKKELNLENAISNYPLIYPFDTSYTREIETFLPNLSSTCTQDLLSECCQLLCEYDYDRILFLAKTMQNNGKSMSHIENLCAFLKTYKRKSEPDNNEQSNIDSNPYLSIETKQFFSNLTKKHLGIHSFFKNARAEVFLCDCFEFAKLADGYNLKADEIFCFAVKNEVEKQVKNEGFPPNFHELSFVLYKISDVESLVELLDDISFFYIKTEDIFALRKHQLNRIKNSGNLNKFDIDFYQERAVEDKILFLLHKNNLFEFYSSIKNGVKLITDIYEHCLMKLQENSNAFEIKSLKELVDEIFKFHLIDKDDFHYNLAMEWLSNDDEKDSRSTLESHSFLKMLSKNHSSISKVVQLLLLHPETSLLSNLKSLVNKISTDSNLLKARILSVLQHLHLDFTQLFNTTLNSQTLLRYFYYWADLQSFKVKLRIEDLLTIGNIEKSCAKLIFNQVTNKKALQFLTAFAVQEDLKDSSIYIQILELLLKIQDFESLIIYLKFMMFAGKKKKIFFFVVLKQEEIFVEAAKVLVEPCLVKYFVECTKFGLTEKTILEVLRIFSSSFSDHACKAAFWLVGILGEFFKTYLICLMLPCHFQRIVKFSYMINLNLDLSSKESFIRKAERSLKYFSEIKSLVCGN